MTRISRIGLGLVLLALLTCIACVPPTAQQRRSSARRNTKWNPAPGFCCANGWTPAGDVNGEVGHPLSITGPGAHCWGAGNGAPDTRAQQWNANMYVASGSLPPGLVMNSNGSINGIPTQRGHWIVRMQVANATCGGQAFPNMTAWYSDIRFHITGSGQVVQ